MLRFQVSGWPSGLYYVRTENHHHFSTPALRFARPLLTMSLPAGLYAFRASSSLVPLPCAMSYLVP